MSTEVVRKQTTATTTMSKSSGLESSMLGKKDEILLRKTQVKNVKDEVDSEVNEDEKSSEINVEGVTDDGEEGEDGDNATDGSNVAADAAADAAAKDSVAIADTVGNATDSSTVSDADTVTAATLASAAVVGTEVQNESDESNSQQNETDKSDEPGENTSESAPTNSQSSQQFPQLPHFSSLTQGVTQDGPPPHPSFQFPGSGSGSEYQSNNPNHEDYALGRSPHIHGPGSGSGNGRHHGSHHGTGTQCQNCHTQNTPLWRRDESGQVLCNACGLFLKLHGRARPISLKTDIIKSRNRVRISVTPNGATVTPVSSLENSNGFTPASQIGYNPHHAPDSIKRKRSVKSRGSSRNSSPALTPKGEPLYGNNLPPIVDHSYSGLQPPRPYLNYPPPPGQNYGPIQNGNNQPYNNAPQMTSPLMIPTHSSQQAYRNGSTGSNDGNKDGAGLTVLDQLSAAASASPYLSANQEGKLASTSSTSSSPHNKSNANSEPSSPPHSISTKALEDAAARVKAAAAAAPTSQDPQAELQLLRTRVSELEVVNDLYKGKIGELEALQASHRSSEESLQKKNQQLTKELEKVKSQLKDSNLSEKKTRSSKEEHLLEGKDSDSKRKKLKVSDLL